MFIPIWLVYLILFALLGGSMFMYGVLIDEQPNAGFFKKIDGVYFNIYICNNFSIFNNYICYLGVIQGVICGVRESRK